MPDRSSGKSPPRSVRPTEPGEQHVAAEDDRRIELLRDEDDRAGAVAGDLADPEHETRHLELVAVGDQAIGRRGSGPGRPKEALMLASGSESSAVSLRPMISGTSGNASFIAGLPAMWSTWPWVFRIAAGRSRAACRSRSTDRVSNPGSTTTASVRPSSHAT